jgi:hypothetical protein
MATEQKPTNLNGVSAVERERERWRSRGLSYDKERSGRRRRMRSKCSEDTREERLKRKGRKVSREGIDSMETEQEANE